MRPSTLVLDALSPAGRRAASSLAARGKDLVLTGHAAGLLDELAAELRVVHGVEVRTCTVDLTAPEAVGHAASWVSRTNLAVDALVLSVWEQEDPVRAAQLEQTAISLRDELLPAFQRAGVEPRLRVDAVARKPMPAGRPLSEAPRARRSTRPGHDDPSNR